MDLNEFLRDFFADFSYFFYDVTVWFYTVFGGVLG